MGMGKAIDFSGVVAASWFGLPSSYGAGVRAERDAADRPGGDRARGGETSSHIKAIGVMTGRNLDYVYRPGIHRRRRGHDAVRLGRWQRA